MRIHFVCGSYQPISFLGISRDQRSQYNIQKEDELAASIHSRMRLIKTWLSVFISQTFIIHHVKSSKQV